MLAPKQTPRIISALSKKALGSSETSTTQNTRDTASLPLIDVSALMAENPSEEALKSAVDAIGNACRTWGFFYITNHGVSVTLQEQLQAYFKKFFALPLETKQEIAIENAGKSWRGYFSMGGEKTNKRPDYKEGVNYGVDHSLNDPRVVEGRPLHGPNLYPADVPEIKPIMVEYLATLEKLGHSIMKGIALSLELPADYFDKNYLNGQNYRCNVLNYPPDVQALDESNPRWGVGEHSDYGLLTILKQDNSGGLEVKSLQHGWVKATPIDNTFVCNIGDMLQTVTKGLYVSTIHRARNVYTGKERFSCPFFFDPDWDTLIEPLPLAHLRDRESKVVQSVEMNAADSKPSYQKYGDYAVEKYSKSFAPVKKEN